jgi:hypothetical protein
MTASQSIRGVPSHTATLEFSGSAPPVAETMGSGLQVSHVCVEASGWDTSLQAARFPVSPILSARCAARRW